MITATATPIVRCPFNPNARRYVKTGILGIDSLKFYHLIIFFLQIKGNTGLDEDFFSDEDSRQGLCTSVIISIKLDYFL